ncbi:MAG: ABC transporter permease, partial [Oscillospiraceae bacterium]
MCISELSPARKRWLHRQRGQRLMIAAAKVSLLLGFVLLWETAARQGWIDPFITSSPTRLWNTITRLTASGALWLHLGVTTLEAVAGFV